MKCLIFLYLSAGLLLSCSSEKGDFELKKSTYNNIYSNSFEFEIKFDNLIMGYRDYCSEYRRSTMGDAFSWKCEMLEDMDKIKSVFDSYNQNIINTESLAAYYFDLSYNKRGGVGSLKSFPSELMNVEITNTEVLQSLEKTVAYLDTFYDSLSMVLIDVFDVEDTLVLYDIAARHKRKEAWKKVESIYPDLPVYVYDKSVYQEMYCFGITNDYSKMLESVSTQYDCMLLLVNLKLELNRLAYSISVHRRYKITYCGPSSEFFKSEMHVRGPSVVYSNEKFVLNPRMIFYDPYLKGEVEYSGKVKIDSFQVTKDTLIKGEYIIKKRNGVHVRYPFEKRIKVASNEQRP